MKTNYPDSLTIQQYLKGQLDPELMHQLEKQALDDPFLWEALEGYTNTTDAGRNLSILQRQLHERIVHLQENKKVFDLTWQRLSVAAAAAVLFIAAGILFWMNSAKSKPELASNQKQVEVKLTDPDSLSLIVHSPIAEIVAAKEPQAAESKVSAYNPPKVIKENVTTVTASSKVIAASPAEDEVSARADVAPVMSAAPAARMSKKQDSTDPAVNSSQVQLSEIVVSASPDQSAQPLAGWDLYRQYLELNIRKPQNQPALKGIVLLSFDVDNDGKINNFKVLKGLSDAYNAEAIRLIKEGPAWKGAADGQTKQGRVEVIF